MGMKRKTKIKRLRTTKAVNELELMFEAVTDLLSIHDQDFRIVRVNRAFAGAAGITPEKLSGQRHPKLPNFRHSYAGNGWSGASAAA